MKKIFRFLRGELLNGFYIKSIQDLMNNLSQNIVDFFYKFNNQKFMSKGMEVADIYNIGKIAGSYLPLLGLGEGYGALYLSDSYKENDVERSERGLLKKETESFEFFHTEQDDYKDDINTLTNNKLKSSLIEENAPVWGYLSSTNKKILNAEGEVDISQVLSKPPTGVAYTEYYGDTFTYLAEQLLVGKFLPVDLYYSLFIVEQNIRYNGINIKSLCNLIEILCPNGLIKIQSIEVVERLNYFNINYVINNDIELDNKAQRLETIKFILGLKFHQFILNEVENTN